MNKLLSSLADPPVEYRAVPFWFINHCPEEKMLREQIRAMREAGFGGVMLHARNGLQPCEYLNERWEKTVRTVLSEVKAQGMQLWLYDELHYPSGPAGGRILDRHPDSPIQYLELAYEGETVPEGDFARVVKSPKGYMAFRIRTQRQYPDYLDKEVMADFVAISYHWYAERFAEDFGSVIKGEFTDNPCGNFGVYRRSIPWTPSLPTLFKEQTGMDLDTVLPSLFTATSDAHLHRLVFWRFFNKLFLDTFILPIEDECARNGIAATGHYCIEDGTSEHVRQLGDRFEQKLHQHIPAVDMLGSSSSDANAAFPLGTMSAMIGMTTSPAYFYHCSRVMCECLGLTDGWGMTLAEALRMCGTLAALGIDFFVPHGFYYSIAANRKRECVPDFLHNTMFEFLPILTKRLAQLSMLSSHSLHIAETALFYPLTAQQASIELLGPGLRHGEICEAIDSASRSTADTLIKGAIPFEFISEDIIQSAQVIDDELVIQLPDGKEHRIRTIVMPSAWIVEERTLAVLSEFQRAGGLVVTIGDGVSAVFDGKAIKPAKLKGVPFDISKIRQNMRHSRISLASTHEKILLREWIKDGQYFAMLQNFSREQLNGVEIACRFEPSAIDLENGGCTRMPKSFTHDFAYGDTLLLTEAAAEDAAAQEAPPAEDFHEFQIPVKEWKVELESPNTLIPDSMSFTADIVSRTWKCTFSIDEMPDRLFMAMDMEPTLEELLNHATPFSNGKQENGEHEDGHVKVYVNGTIVHGISTGRHFDRWMPEADISRLVRVGENTVTFVHFPTIVLDTSRPMEPPVIFGHFGTKNGRIVRVPEALPFPRWDGTPLERYSGAASFSADVDIPQEARGRRIRLLLENVREIAEVFADGRKVGVAVKPPFQFEIPSDVRRLTLRLVNTPANTWQEPLPSGVTGRIVWSTM